MSVKITLSAYRSNSFYKTVHNKNANMESFWSEVIVSVRNSVFFEFFQQHKVEQCMSVCLKHKILVIAEPIGLYSSGNTPTGHVMVLSFFLKEMGPPPQKKEPLVLYLLIVIQLLNKE